ncbi:DUF2332 domain-containing protein [Pelagibius sp.]|uniref:DUF2332 domain-containing protein n=1 Tax=Pelagibius sp. TaxID=1931238 RepID=UPI003BAF851F
MTGDAAVLEELSQSYRRFAQAEAHGVSAVYEDLALFIGDSPELLGFIATFPDERRQPNLFLAAVRHLAGVPASGDGLVRVVRERPQDLRRIMLKRTTQTNEPARCATLLPLLARLPQPLALVEVGASAGLCLLPDRYGYDYGDVSLRPELPSGTMPPEFPCKVGGNTPLPMALPRVVWRRGLDLNPLDPGSQSDVAWLQTLVWPGQEERAERLQAAVTVARQDPPKVQRGDLFVDLDKIIEAAPDEATLVVFHSAVLAYIGEEERREAFAEKMMNASAVWISNESPRVFPRIAAQAPPSPTEGSFLLSIDGQPVAWTGPHGQSLDWFA